MTLWSRATAPGLLLAAFAGLRLAEVCGLRVSDVDFMRGTSARSAVPGRPPEDRHVTFAGADPQDLALMLSAHVEDFSTEWIMCDEVGRQMGPWQLQRAFRAARSEVKGLPEGFRFHDLRHYYASLLISLRPGCEGRASPAAARFSQYHSRHLRASVARF